MMDPRDIVQQALRRFTWHAVVAVAAGIVLAAATAAFAMAAVSSNRALARDGTRATATVVRVEHTPFRGYGLNGSDRVFVRFVARERIVVASFRFPGTWEFDPALPDEVRVIYDPRNPRRIVVSGLDENPFEHPLRILAFVAAATIGGLGGGMLMQRALMNRLLKPEAAWRTESTAEIGPRVIALGPKPLLFYPAGFRLRLGRAWSPLDSTLVAQGPSQDMLVITTDGFVIRARPPGSDRQARRLERRYRAISRRW